MGCLGTAASPCTRTPFQGGGKNGVPTFDVIPGNRISQASKYINQFWVPYENIANQNVYTNNLNYGTPTGLSNWYSTGRIDYNQSARNQIAASSRSAARPALARTRRAVLGRRSIRRSPITRSPPSTS